MIASFADSLASLPSDKCDSAVLTFININPVTPIIESDTVFSLYWFGNAGQVLVNGDLQAGWSVPDTMDFIDMGDYRFFYISFIVPSDSRLDYLLIVDTVSTTDPRNPLMTPSGYGSHSGLAMPGFKSDSLWHYREDVPQGRLDSLMFTSTNPLILPRQLEVYLPADYNSLKDLPVIYVLDGLEALKYMSYRSVLDNLISAGKIEPAIAVFIPPGEHFPEKIGEKTEAFLRAICDEMVPLIDSSYKTAVKPEKRAISGISAGGHFALFALFSRSDIFHCGAGQSPTISNKIYDAMHAMIGKGRYDSGMKIYIDMGLFDLPGGTINELSFLQAGRYLDRELHKFDISHIYREFNDGHEWANWRERTDEILLFFFAKKIVNQDFYAEHSSL